MAFGVYQNLSIKAEALAANAITSAKIKAGEIVDSDINASAAIALSKLDAVTASKALVSDSNGHVSASDVTATELAILDGVTATTAELNYLDITTLGTSENSKVVTQSSSGAIVIGATSGNQTIDIASHDLVDGGLKLGGTLVTASAAELNIMDGVTATAAELNLMDGVTATTAELNYVDGVTSAIQTQMDAKAPIASPTFTGTPAAPTAAAATNTTQLATTAFVQTAVANLIDSAPGALDTLNELAAAINDDASFSTTVTNLITANETHIDNMATLTGVAKDETHLSTFTGSTISDNVTVKAALQSLETSVELKAPIANPTFTGEIGIGAVNVSETELGILEGATVTTAELNILDGVTASTTELNLLDGVTSTTTELNLLDGVAATNNVASKVAMLDSGKNLGLQADLVGLNSSGGNVIYNFTQRYLAGTLTPAQAKAAIVSTAGDTKAANSMPSPHTSRQQVWGIDPGGSDYQFSMPAADNGSPGTFYKIFNAADDDENLVIKDSAGNALVTIPQGGSVTLIDDGTAYRIF